MNMQEQQCIYSRSSCPINGQIHKAQQWEIIVRITPFKRFHKVEITHVPSHPSYVAYMGDKRK